ncbi:hypothetical protein [Nocardiopsis sp. NPDC055824]
MHTKPEARGLYPDLDLTPAQREKAARRRVRADFPRGARVAGQDERSAFVGRVVSYHERRIDHSARPQDALARPTLVVGPVVRGEDGAEREVQSEHTFRVPNLTRRQEWLLVAAHHHGGQLTDRRPCHHRISEELVTNVDGRWDLRLTRRGAILARALAPLVPLPRLGYRQLRSLAIMRAEGGTVTYHACILTELGIHDNIGLQRLGLIDEAEYTRHLVLSPLGERALAEAPRVSDLLQAALAEHGLTGRVADISGGAEALVLDSPDGQLLVMGRTSSRIRYRTWAHEGLDVYLAPHEEGSWLPVHTSRETNAEADVREAAAAIAAHTQRAARA